MKRKLFQLRTLTTVAVVFALAPLAQAQTASTWTGGDIGNSLNWSDASNWGASGAPTATSSSDAVTFPVGAFPVTTNTQGMVNNVVQSSTSINSLTYLNTTAGTYYTTLIPNGSILTVAQGLTIGSTSPNTVTMAGAGSLIAGTNGSSTLSLPNTSGTTLLDLSS